MKEIYLKHKAKEITCLSGHEEKFIYKKKDRQPRLERKYDSLFIRNNLGK
jgi:hypothetical protein